MLKNLLKSTIGLFCIIFFASCGKCKECHCQNYWTNDTDIYEICRDNFMSNSDYKDYIEDRENQGCKCKADILW